MFKSGFVSIVGRPNVGKSTLLNSILETKLAIMSDVAQTTRNTIQGIHTDDEAQIILWIHQVFINRKIVWEHL